MFANSLFYYHMLENGLDAYKDESTRDVICIDFSYGTRSYENEVAHLKKMIKDEEDPEKKQIKEEVLRSVEENKYKYRECSKDEIRRDFYVNGVPVEYKHVDKNGNVISTEIIRYRMLYRNASKAKIGQSVFINEKLYDAADDWITMGLRDKLPHDKAMIVELSAYAPLVTSSIIDRFHMSLDEVLILDEQESSYHTIADVIKSADYETMETVVDEEATEHEKQKAIAAGKLDIHGEPIYKKKYKKVSVTKKRCIVEREETEVTNAVWDGMALIEDSFAPGTHGMVLLRNHFFKACAFRANIQLFIKDYCAEHNIDYDTFELTDIFGRKVLAKNIKMITNKDACKWWKFQDIMGGTELAAYEYWRKRVESDGSIWGIVKEDHVSKLGDNHEIQQLSYQAINALPCEKEDIRKIANTSIKYVESLKIDNDEFEKFLRKNATEVNHYEMLADLYKWNPEFANSKMWKSDKKKIINNYVNTKLRKGKITVTGDNLTVNGNPYALLLYAVGEDWQQDPTLRPEKGVIQCYTTRFEDGEYLCGIRSPHNSPTNTGYFKNVRHPLMEKYMAFSPNIISVNCIQTDVQSRLNGMDFDADSMLVTNQPEMVEAARISYRDFPTAMNAIGQSNKTYKNEMSEYAKMDSTAQNAQLGIGLSSNLAQMGLSYLWTKKARGEIDNEYMELYHSCIILATIAQILIDGIKRSFEVDGMQEIERIQNLPSMQRFYEEETENGEKVLVRRDLPRFMEYIREPPLTKNGKEIPYKEVSKKKKVLHSRIDPNIICPMNWLEECLDKIQGFRTDAPIDTSEFYIYKSGAANHKQMGKVRKIIEEYDAWTRSHISDKRLIWDEDEFIWNEFKEKSEYVLESIRKFSISDITMNRLISSALGIDAGVRNDSKYKKASRYTRKMLNMMYKYDKKRFLNNFKR